MEFLSKLLCCFCDQVYKVLWINMCRSQNVIENSSNHLVNNFKNISRISNYLANIPNDFENNKYVDKEKPTDSNTFRCTWNVFFSWFYFCLYSLFEYEAYYIFYFYKFFVFTLSIVPYIYKGMKFLSRPGYQKPMDRPCQLFIPPK